MTVASVSLWGTRIGAVSQDGPADPAAFQYDTGFRRSGIEIAPLTMPLRTAPYVFPGLSYETFRGLPGLLADSLPDRFGSALIDAWLASQGRTSSSFSSIDRLCYIGRRGMGALEFAPALGPRMRRSRKLEVDALVELASEVLGTRQGFSTSFADRTRTKAMQDILMVGTSAGGARAKAVIAWNPATSDVRSGQVAAPPGFEYWILKFDGVSGNRDKELDDPEGYGAIELAYSRMAAEAGIEMTKCRLLEEGGRRHFMTQRFDREADGSKRHMQSLGALAHFDFNQPGAHSYEQAFQVIRDLGLGQPAIEQQFRRMVFNIVGRNQDDHVKNIAFLMSRAGTWSLAPAFDVTYAYRPSGQWTGRHQMTMNGKSDNFTVADFEDCGRVARLKSGSARAVLDEVIEIVSRWPAFAAAAGVDGAHQRGIEAALRLRFPAR